MSLINEALKKAEKEKTKPNLFGVEASEGSPTRKPGVRKRGFLLLLIVGL